MPYIYNKIYMDKHDKYFNHHINIPSYQYIYIYVDGFKQKKHWHHEVDINPAGLKGEAFARRFPSAWMPPRPRQSMPFTVLQPEMGGDFPWVWPERGGHIPWENVGKCRKMWENMMLTRKNWGFHQQDSSFSLAKMKMTSKRFHQETKRFSSANLWDLSSKNL